MMHLRYSTPGIHTFRMPNPKRDRKCAEHWFVVELRECRINEIRSIFKSLGQKLQTIMTQESS
jgi:16S rRNA U516 pseudouridylate synthase RsuA-like enzyme